MSRDYKNGKIYCIRNTKTNEEACSLVRCSFSVDALLAACGSFGGLGGTVRGRFSASAGFDFRGSDSCASRSGALTCSYEPAGPRFGSLLLDLRPPSSVPPDGAFLWPPPRSAPGFRADPEVPAAERASSSEPALPEVVSDR